MGIKHYEEMLLHPKPVDNIIWALLELLEPIHKGLSLPVDTNQYAEGREPEEYPAFTVDHHKDFAVCLSSSVEVQLQLPIPPQRIPDYRQRHQILRDLGPGRPVTSS